MMKMMTWTRPRVWDVLPFASMVTMEGCTIALTIWAKTVLTNGMSPFVFVVYTHTLSSLILIPFSFFFHRNDSTEQPLFTWNMFWRVFLMGLTGITIPQNLAFMGLAFSSPIVVCAMGLTFPSLSFIVSIILRKTNINLGSSSFVIKVIGTIVCFMGATMVELYKGPIIRHTSSYHLRLLTTNKYLIFSSPTHEHWILGGLFLAASSLSVSLWNNIQMGTAKLYPQPMKIASFYSVVGTVQTAALAFFVLERDPNAWKLDVSMEIPLIILTATFVSLLRSCVHMWCMKMKGSFYVPMFRPFGLVFASIFGTSLPHSTLRYGSVIGTAIVALGYFTVMHGQMNEDESSLPTKKQINGDIESGGSSEEYKVPLLQDQADVGV